MLASALCGCSTKAETEQTGTENKETESNEWITSEDFSLPTGMTAERASSFPGLNWEIDTLHGMCAPDTLLIWADYNGARYTTNVQGIVGKPMTDLKLSGNEKVESGLTFTLDGTDFKPSAVIIDNPYGSLDNMREAKMKEFYHKTEMVTEMVKNFFITGGSSEYMRGSLATIWERDYNESLEYGETINPFNNGYAAKFAADKINVVITDASRGIVEVEVYETDPYSLGHPGWTYWTVEICKEPDGYKIKELPAIHRKFEKGE